MHLAAWGKVDTGRGNAIDMTLGIPGPSLLPLGLTDLPEDYVFTIPMRGTSQHPEIDIVRRATIDPRTSNHCLCLEAGAYE